VSVQFGETFGDGALPVRNRSGIRIRDPFVVPDAVAGMYYIYSWTAVEEEGLPGRRGVGVYRTPDLEMWEGPVPVFLVPDDFWASEAVWAPEVHAYQGRWYLFVTFTSKDVLPTPPGRPQNVKRATQVLAADSLLGPFVPFGNGPTTPEDWMALDGTLWVEEGVPYMLFCHEWIQITDGSIDIVRLKPDLSGMDGKPRCLFHASEASWTRCRGDLGETFQGKRYHAYVTDGPFIYRTKAGKLLMLWASYGAGKYTQGVCISASGSVQGPWVQVDEPLFVDDGGHGMLFRTFDGRLVLVLHQPNRKTERARFFKMEDTGDLIRIVQEIVGSV
jgi:arabinan endo-1,5-alpha-L-arabinosidase